MEEKPNWSLKKLGQVLRGVSGIKHLDYPGVREEVQGMHLPEQCRCCLWILNSHLWAQSSCADVSGLGGCGVVVLCRQGYKGFRGDHLFTSKVSSIGCSVEYFPFTNGTAESCSKANNAYIMLVFSGLVWGFFLLLELWDVCINKL